MSFMEERRAHSGPFDVQGESHNRKEKVQIPRQHQSGGKKRRPYSLRCQKRGRASSPSRSDSEVASFGRRALRSDLSGGEGV